MGFSSLRAEVEEVLNQATEEFKETVQKAESDVEKVAQKFIAREKKKGAARLKAAMEVVDKATKDFKDAIHKAESDFQKAMQVIKQAIEKAVKVAAAAEEALDAATRETADKEALDAAAKEGEESSEG
ncbi:hypothetical protein QYE76_044886 [Lolium multiflorum]|uniref:Uncharacterized protein n=1 Tax=Lolium multiflorum TaxID=4521 RepID=A0AAD8TLX8_LOLMU|nr:hypothetical protein QYE76_044886 [Lolium multiflorum]